MIGVDAAGSGVEDLSIDPPCVAHVPCEDDLARSKVRSEESASNYRGIASLRGFSVQDAPALAAMLSAASVVGLLEQLNGQGILFSDGDVEFELRPEGVEITRGAAVGASMGISFSGLYRAKSGTMDIQGTISPIYLLNGIGRLLSVRKGEGLFGFTYRLTGPVDAMKVSVNPLSILTPGMFREIFRRPPPRLEGNG